MRSALSAALAALAFTFATGWTHAQDAAGLPKAPVPYSRLHPKPRPKTIEAIKARRPHRPAGQEAAGRVRVRTRARVGRPRRTSR